MNTVFLLMAQYNAQAIIPVATVVKDYFPHLTTENFVRKVSMGDINIPMVRIEPKSQKSAKGVHVNDLAQYLDARRAAAVKEALQLCSR
ncbi:MAG: pyocin activator PrtN family protein [Hydrogenophaga sp.]|uniref:pyocin activator PrtN family protein n=1 Tax=Hydrogenophaga sp. TaxID=1904254 RepID=UPI0026183073|nr:pyocin activator PrtN family protein [Hydrogenophaga sp.]MDM7942567.1 pyocin activator PrtN family protein [Hydrogenophaga sp.]